MLIDKQSGRAIAPPPGVKTSIKLETPRPYDGAKDTEVFNAWLNGMLQWMELNYLGGPEHNTERVAYTPHFLKGELET